MKGLKQRSKLLKGRSMLSPDAPTKVRQRTRRRVRSRLGFYSPRAQQQIAVGHRILAPVDKMHFTRAVALAHLPANQPWAILRGPDWIVGITKVEQKRRAPRPVIAPKKRVTRKVEDLSRLLSELQRLREQVQRAEA